MYRVWRRTGEINVGLPIFEDTSTEEIKEGEMCVYVFLASGGKGGGDYIFPVIDRGYELRGYK